MTENTRSNEEFFHAPPSGMNTLRLVFGLTLLRAKRSKILRITFFAMAFVLITLGIGRLSGKSGVGFYELILNLFLRYFTPLTLALFASQSISEEVTAKTITYLWSRPIKRWALPFGKYIATAIISFLLLSIALIVAYTIAMVGNDFLYQLPLLALSLVALALATLYFGALAMAFGAITPSFPFALMLIYILILDVGVGFLPGYFKAGSMITHLCSIAGIYHPQSGYFSDPNLTPGISLIVVSALTAIWIAIALSVANSSEYRG